MIATIQMKMEADVDVVDHVTIAIVAIAIVAIAILSRVGDRPTATILQVQFHFFDFCLVF